LENPRPVGAESSLTGRCSSPFQTEPRQFAIAVAEMPCTNRSIKVPSLHVQSHQMCNRTSAHFQQVVYNQCGGVAEWLNATVLKTVRPVRVSGVRIPPPPPLSSFNHYLDLMTHRSRASGLPFFALYPNLSQCEYNGLRNRCRIILNWKLQHSRKRT